MNKSDVKGYSVTVRENANQKWQQTRGNKTWGKRYIQCFVVGYGSFFLSLVWETEIFDIFNLASHLWKYKKRFCLTREITPVSNTKTLNILYVQLKLFVCVNAVDSYLVWIYIHVHFIHIIFHFLFEKLIKLLQNTFDFKFRLETRSRQSVFSLPEYTRRVVIWSWSRFHPMCSRHPFSESGLAGFGKLFPFCCFVFN